MRPFYTPHQLRHDQDDILFINEHWGEIKEAYFQVLEALKAPIIEQPSTPTPEGGCECTWIKKTFIPTYFYITRDSSVSDVSEEEIQDFFNNLVAAYMYTDKRERFSPLVKLDVKGAVFALPIPHVTGNNNLVLYSYSFTGVIDDSGHPERDTPPFYNEMVLDIYANTGVLHGNKISLTLHKNADKEYLYLSHTNTETDPTPMTFKFLETIKPFVVENNDSVDTPEDKPEDTPEDNPDIPPEEDEPEGVLTPYTLKVRFTPDYWYDGDAKFGAYCEDTQKWREANKIVDGVVYYIFTEEEVLNTRVWIFTRHNPTQEMSWESMLTQTMHVSITFEDTIMNDVITIHASTPKIITVGKAYV